MSEPLDDVPHCDGTDGCGALMGRVADSSRIQCSWCGDEREATQDELERCDRHAAALESARRREDEVNTARNAKLAEARARGTWPRCECGGLYAYLWEPMHLECVRCGAKEPHCECLHEHVCRRCLLAASFWAMMGRRRRAPHRQQWLPNIPRRVDGPNAYVLQFLALRKEPMATTLALAMAANAGARVQVDIEYGFLRATQCTVAAQRILERAGFIRTTSGKRPTMELGI